MFEKERSRERERKRCRRAWSVVVEVQCLLVEHWV